MKIKRALAFCSILGVQSHFVMLAQEKQPPTQPAAPAASQATPTKKPIAKEVLAIVGGDIITVTRERIRGGTILIEDGKIVAVGQDVKVPEGATKIDAVGRTVTPGFVAIDVARIGLATTGSPDRNGKIVDTLDPFDRNISLGLGVGITTGCVEIRTGGGGFPRRGVSDGFPITERFLGFDPDIIEDDAITEPAQRDYGPFVSLCKCCGLPIIPTEPLENTQKRLRRRNATS